MGGRGEFPAPYQSLAFSVGPACGGEDCAYTPLRFDVKEVWGTSEQAAVGERYVVRGEYTLLGDKPHSISLAVFEEAFGATAHVSPGSGSFETSTEILKLVDNAPNALGVVVGPQSGGGQIVAWITLEPQ